MSETGFNGLQDGQDCDSDIEKNPVFPKLNKSCSDN